MAEGYASKLTGKSFQKGFPKSLQKAFGSVKNLNTVIVAEDDNLPGVLYGVIPAALHFPQKMAASDNALYIPRAAAHHAAYACGLGVEDFLHPDVSRQHEV
ncbi:hypothetical protein [Roseovarius phycicola]|uniref:hypothetical protein n=1 Tax=Roseovarius phycicola TaxID=3080976 RepID=UPI0030CD3228